MSKVVKSDNEKSGNFPDLVNAQTSPNSSLQYEKSCNALDKPNDLTEENKKENANTQMDIVPEPANFNLVTQLNQNNPRNKDALFITKIETNTTKAPKNKWKEATAPNTLPFKKRKKVNKDNIVKGALKPPFPHFVKLVEKFGGIKLKRVNLRKVFGGVKTCKKAVELKLYQIICFDKKGENKSILKNSKDEKLFKYLLSRKYKFLLCKYNQKNPKFYIDGENQKIPGFPYIDEVLENVYKDYPYIKKVRKINRLKIMASKIVNNFKGLKEYNPQKGGGYEEGFSPEYLEIFEENQEIENYSDLDSNNLKKEKEIKDESSLSLSESESESESENDIPFKKGSKLLIKKKENAKQIKKQLEHYKPIEKIINSNEMDNIFDFNINQELDEKKEFENDNSLYSFCLKLFNPFEEIVELKDYEMNFW